MSMCNFACKGRPRNDLYCVGRDVKPYSLTHSLYRSISQTSYFLWLKVQKSHISNT